MKRNLLLLGLLSSWGAAYAQCTTPAVTANGPTTFCNGEVSLSTALGSVRYATQVLKFSSQYNSSWGAAQALNSPNIYPRYGDISGTWASSTGDDQREYLELRFPNPMQTQRILIWETYNPGAVDTVYVRNSSTDPWVPVYTGTAAPAGQNARILNINFPLTAFAVQDVRIALNSPAVPGWNEIDAVALSEEPISYQWLRDGVDLPAGTVGADGPGLANIDGRGAYSVRVSKIANCVRTSTPVNVLAGTAPALTVTPATATICGGAAATLTAAVSTPPAPAAGRGLQFDGFNDQGSMPASPSLNLTTAMTIESWINVSGAGSQIQNLVSKSTNSVNTGYIFPRTDAAWNDLSFWLFIDGTWRPFSVPYASFKNAWHHVAATYDGARVKIFIDGQKQLDVAFAGTVATNANALAIGAQPGFGSEYFNGQADEIRVWNVVRSEAQILADYNKTVSGSQPGLVAYFRLDEGSGGVSANAVSGANPLLLADGFEAPAWINSAAPIEEGIAYTWSPATGLSSTRGAGVSASPTSSTTYTVRATMVNSGCFAERTAQVNVGSGGPVWTGAVSTNWHEAANWSCGAVPDIGTDVTIPGSLSRYPVIDTHAATRHLTILPGAQLTLNNGVFSIYGRFTNNGQFAQNGGSAAMGGGTLDDIGGTASTVFGNLSIGTSGARLVSPIQVRGLLTLGGNLNTNNHMLTLLSDAAGTASVYNNPSVVQGEVTVQRWIDPTRNAGPGYRHLSAPVQGSTVQDLTAGNYTPVVNPNFNTSATPHLVTPYPNIFTYDDTRLQTGGPTGFNQGWMSPAALTDPLVPGRGYTVNLAPQMVDFRGTLTNGNVNIPLTRGTAGAGWNLVGNPYPSPIDWRAVTVPAGVDAAAYVYRSSGRYTGSYLAVVNGIGQPTDQIFAMGQAFFVRVNSGTPTLQLTNIVRTTTLQNPALHRTTETRPVLGLSLKATTGTAPEDVLHVYQQAGATPGFDSGFDAFKVELNGGQQPTLYTPTAAGESLAIQGLPAGSQAVTLPLSVNAPQAGAYRFSIQQVQNFPAGLPLWLEDRQTNTWHDLVQGAYAAQLTQGLSTARFRLHLYQQRPTAARQASLANASLQVYPNPATGGQVQVAAAGLPGNRAELHLLNALGQVVRTETVPLTGRVLERPFDVRQLPAGVYTLQVRTDGGTLSQKVVLH